MMRFTFLQLCAATVPVPIPQQETERNLATQPDLSVELWSPLWTTQWDTMKLQPGPSHEQENMQLIAKELECDPSLVIVVDKRAQMTTLASNGKFWASCVLQKDASMTDTFNQLVLTGLVLHLNAAQSYPEADNPDSLMASKLYESTNGLLAAKNFFTVPKQKARYGNQGQIFVTTEAKTDNNDWTVMFCLSPFDLLCKDKIEISAQITSRNNYKMHVIYYQNQVKRAEMSRDSEGSSVSEEVSETGTPKELSDPVKQKFRAFVTGNLSFVAAEDLASNADRVKLLHNILTKPAHNNL